LLSPYQLLRVGIVRHEPDAITDDRSTLP